MSEINKFIEEIENAVGKQKPEVGVFFSINPNEYVPVEDYEVVYTYFYMELSELDHVTDIYRDREEDMPTGLFVNTTKAHLYDVMSCIEDAVLALDVPKVLNPYEILEFHFNEHGYDKVLEEYSGYFNFLFEKDKENIQKQRLVGMWEIFEKKYIPQEDGFEEAEEEEEENIKMEPFEKIVAFSPEMSAYIEEMKRVIITLKKIKAQNKFFETSVLLSVDEGWGKEEFVRSIIKVLSKEFKIDESDISIEKREYSSIKNNQFLGCHPFDFDDTEQEIDHLTVKVTDLSQEVSEFNSPKFKNDIREYTKMFKNTLHLFVVPYMNPTRLNDLKEIFADVVPTRLVAVPPVSLENMVVYLKDKLEESNCQVEGACDDCIEQWICQEKMDGLFYGYETLDKMAAELLYEKALCTQESETSADEMEKITATDIRRMYEDFKETADAYELFDELVGMVDFKVKIKEIVAQIQFLKEMEAQGKDVEKPSMHMLFLGNPGTGKTSMARIVGKVFKQEGLLRKGNFIEVTGSSFVHRKIGDSSEKMRTTCREARGNILFVDEAYGMSVGHNNGNVTDEILPVLVAEMENNRDDLCIIFAGLPITML